MEKEKVYLFNPDTDMALADNRENYMPPAPVRQMALDLALLPLWYADEGSLVWAASDYNADFLRRANCQWKMNVRLVTTPELQEMENVEYLPWGWNVALRKRLLGVGVKETLLPSADMLAVWREYASRAWVADWLRLLGHIEGCCGESHNLYDEDACRRFVECHAASVLKSPWSGSGKGLNWCKGRFTDAISGWCRRVLDKQGLVTASPVYEKCEDFAMEFYADGVGKADFVGYSLFSTNASGAYEGNWLLSAQMFEDRMKGYGVRQVLDTVRMAVSEVVGIYARFYRGYLGVDMMLCREAISGQLKIHPCVEVNLRMNMGVVALKLYQRLLGSGCSGRFFIDYSPSADVLNDRHKADEQRCPLRVEDGKIREGYFPLTPITPRTNYRAALYVVPEAIGDRI